VNSKQLKFVLATIGSGGLLAMGAFAAVSSGTSAADTLPVAPQARQEASTTKAPDVVATPPITTAPFTIPTGEPQ
jgi:hypothetical protein